MIKKIIHIYFVGLLCFVSVFSSVEESSISRYTQSAKQYAQNVWNKITETEPTVYYALATCGALVGSHLAYFVLSHQDSENQTVGTNADLEQAMDNKISHDDNATKENNHHSGTDAIVDAFWKASCEEGASTAGQSTTAKTYILEENNNSVISTSNSCAPEEAKQKPRSCYGITIEDIRGAIYNYITNGLEKIIRRNADPENPADPFSDSEQINTHLSEKQLTRIGKKVSKTGTSIAHTSKNYAAQLWNWIKTTDFRKEASDFIQSSGPNKHGRWREKTGNSQ